MVSDRMETENFYTYLTTQPFHCISFLGISVASAIGVMENKGYGFISIIQINFQED